jgi:tRNA modification GTPase
MTDTIFALASGQGRAGIAVYRLSGPASGPALVRLSGKSLPPPRQAMRVTLADIDDGLALWFPAPSSFTGEDVVELHLHGGRAVARALATALLDCGLRPAEAGEFSRRAVANGKLDLTRAEAAADLIDAGTEAQRRQARAQMAGGLESLVEDWRARLVAALAHVEAVIDFADEGIADDQWRLAAETIAVLGREVSAALADGGRGERVRQGLEVAIVGAPNAGKSSLLNRIAGRQAAIVSGTAGTTRDVVEVHLDLGGWPVILADTAGLRAAAEEVEAEGVRRALARAEAAGLKLAVFDAAAEADAATLALVDDATLVVVNKCDLAPAPPAIGGRPALAVSALGGEGMETLLAALESAVAERFAGGAVPVFTRERHRAAARDCLAALERFAGHDEIELAAEELRLAGRALGRITGRIDAEELLDVIFRDFCIGK